MPIHPATLKSAEEWIRSYLTSCGVENASAIPLVQRSEKHFAMVFIHKERDYMLDLDLSDILGIVAVSKHVHKAVTDRIDTLLRR